MKIQILSDPEDVASLVLTVQKQADANKQSLGFLPKRVYSEAALQSKLLVAVEDKTRRYAGHLLFGGISPRGRVFQIFVSTRYRRRAVGQLLLRHLVAEMERSYYLSISAQVAADLTQANAFWAKMGFTLVQTKPGGASRRRILNIRVRDLNTPNLFNFRDLIASGEAADLHLVDRLFAQSPIYLIDLNVLFDVTKQRLRARESGLVMNAGFRNLVRVAVSEEFVDELRRTSVPKPDDPLLALALELPRLSPPSKTTQEKIFEGLATLVFPDRSEHGALTTQDRSDLVHLATAIHHKAAGFVTGEKSILRARENLRRMYGIDVVGVGEFAETMGSSGKNGGVLRGRLQGIQVCAADVSEQNRSSVQAFLNKMYVPARQVLEASSSTPVDVPVRRMILTAGEEPIAFGSWALPRGPKPISEGFLCVDQDHQAAESTVEYLVGKICKECSQSAPALIKLRQMPGHSVTLRIAMAHGFRATDGFRQSEGVLQKIAVGRPIHDSNWGWVRSELESLAGVRLPESMPTDVLSDRIAVTSPSGKRVQMTLNDLETLLSPVLFVSKQRSGAIVPLRREFAELLLESRQFRMLESPEVTFLNERTYFSSPRTASIILEGSCLLFYESGKGGGQSAVVAVARVVRVTIESRESVSSASQRRGVLDAKTLKRLGSDEKVAVTRFDNLIMLRRPVSLARLRELGCADGSNFVTAKRLDGTQVIAILKEGEAGA
jgi:GNAT superfamily N-acetyltransferase/predicted nucleic acid-binding protein